MSAPVNLRRFRKARARADKRRHGDANAAKHGRTKAERELAEARNRKQAHRLEQHRITPEEEQ